MNTLGSIAYTVIIFLAINAKSQNIETVSKTDYFNKFFTNKICDKTIGFSDFYFNSVVDLHGQYLFYLNKNELCRINLNENTTKSISINKAQWQKLLISRN